MCSVFVIIVTYNGLRCCLGSLIESEMLVQIVVIDNASKDETVAYIKEQFPEIHLIESQENLGFAKANNIGMRYALDHGADYVFLLNQDAWINEKNTISELVRISKENPQYYILAPLQQYAVSGRIERETLYHFYDDAISGNDYLSDVYLHQVKDDYESSYACAACWLLPIETVKRIGGFDPLLHHYGEDDNYIQRVKYHGGQLAICPKVSMSHDIENRSKEYRDSYLDWKKYMLINLANINYNFDVKSILRSRLNTIIIQFLRLNKKLLKKSMPEYKFIKQMADKIEQSRQQNKKLGPNWL